MTVRGGAAMAAQRTAAQGVRSEMRPNGSKSRGGNGSRVWEKRKVPRFRGDDYGICRWRYFLSVKKVTKEHRGRTVRLKNQDFKFRIKS